MLRDAKLRWAKLKYKRILKELHTLVIIATYLSTGKKIN